MATAKVFIWVTLCAIVVFASPTRRQFNTETTSSDPVIVVTDDGTAWDDSDEDFDLEGGGWMKEVSASPSSIPESPDYEDYEDEDDDDVAQKDEGKSKESEFLFMQPTDTRLMLEDDDDNQPGIIKVRHTSKNTFSEPRETEALETIEKSKPDDQFVFTIDDDDDDFDDGDNKVDVSDKNDDFVLEDAEPITNSKKDDNSSRREDDDDDDDDEDDDLADNEDDTVFDSPEDDTQVIYGDHVFLY